MELELSDIANYLPYDLDCHVDGEYESVGEEEDDDILAVFTIIGLEKLKTFTWVKMYNNVSYQISSVKPILRPMTDLIKPIVVEGYNNDEEFVPLVELAKNRSSNEGLSYELVRSGDPDDSNWYVNVEMPDSDDSYWFSMIDYYNPSMWIADLLNQWHFDYRDLIGQGLAIDINTLK